MKNQVPSNNSKETLNIKAIGCSFIFMGILGALFGIGGILGIIKNLELEFFGIELNSQNGRVYWVIGCIVFSAIGYLIMRVKKQHNK